MGGYGKIKRMRKRKENDRSFIKQANLYHPFLDTNDHKVRFCQVLRYARRFLSSFIETNSELFIWSLDTISSSS